MSAGGGAMKRGSIISFNKGASATEGVFTERNDRVDHPRHFDEATRTCKLSMKCLRKVK